MRPGASVHRASIIRWFLPVAALFMMGSGSSLQDTIAGTVRDTLLFVGAMALAIGMIGAVHWYLACNDTVRKKAKKLVDNSAFVLVLVILGFIVGKFIVEWLTAAVVQ